METAERIVNSYFNYVRRWATIQNIKCEKGQNEIDILAIDPKGKGKRAHYHIEVSVHTRAPFSKLTANAFSPELLKRRVEKPKQRMTIGYFENVKFGAPGVLEALAIYGFEPGCYSKIIVCDDWTDDAKKQARNSKIELLKFNDILFGLSDYCRTSTKYYGDDTLRTVQLLLRAQSMIP